MIVRRTGPVVDLVYDDTERRQVFWEKAINVDLGGFHNGC